MFVFENTDLTLAIKN